MKPTDILASAVVVTAVFSLSAPVKAQQVLTGDTRLACEAVMCLAAGKRPDECNPSLQKYFSINHRKFSDTLRARGDFLKLCPASNQTPQMQSLVSAIVNGAGRCDSGSLNATLRTYTGDSRTSSYQVTIGNAMPDYCASYVGNELTRLDEVTPKYVGTPARGGLWVKPADYDVAMVAYNKRVAAEDVAAKNGFGGRN